MPGSGWAATPAGTSPPPVPPDGLLSSLSEFMATAPQHTSAAAPAANPIHISGPRRFGGPAAAVDGPGDGGPSGNQNCQPSGAAGHAGSGSQPCGGVQPGC